MATPADDAWLDEDQWLQGGEGKRKKGGLNGGEIEEIMKGHKDFVGVYAIDQIHKLPLRKYMGWVMNLDPISKMGSHWVACLLDARKDMAVEYYDSLADDAPEEFMFRIKDIIDKLNLPVYLKMKINKVKRQADNTNSCGFHACKFLMDRFREVPFVECSGYNEVKKGEKSVKTFKKKFGYV